MTGKKYMEKFGGGLLAEMVHPGAGLGRVERGPKPPAGLARTVRTGASLEGLAGPPDAPWAPPDQE